MTSSYLALELAVQDRHTRLLKEAEAERRASGVPRRTPGWRQRLAAGLYALAAWLSDGALEARRARAWRFPDATADWCNGVEYWCAFPPPLVH